mgnify:FL=1
MGRNHTGVYPENFILPGDPLLCRSDADAVISTAKARCPEWFEGKEDAFFFELRYAAPFEKNFMELKRLQGTAAESAGRRDEFKGYIVIDLSSWLTHHNEEYLRKTLLFLVDMSDVWKYVFLVNDRTEKAAKELIGKLLTVFFRDRIACGIREAGTALSGKERVDAICEEWDAVCSRPVKELLQELLRQGFSESIVSALVSELSCRSGGKIGISALSGFSAEETPVFRYMLAQKEYDKLVDIIARRKELWYGEKETV